ncbi:MAG: DJ-1/PfpI family protein [Patescibacteria group bacterium]|nr:DJ-1/PfpI family protein [Patescibacteria group bacterium]
MFNKSLQGKKIAMVIAQQDFHDEELFIPRSIFLQEGAEVKIVSTKKGEAIGSYGGVIDVDLTFSQLKVADFEAILFIEGSGAMKYIDDEKCHQLAQEAISKNKVLGAIGIAPAILARSGVLKGKKATVWRSTLDKSAVKILKEEGANYQEEKVVIDGKIVTADGPQSARKFGETVVRVLAPSPLL